VALRAGPALGKGRGFGAGKALQRCRDAPDAAARAFNRVVYVAGNFAGGVLTALAVDRCRGAVDFDIRIANNGRVVIACQCSIEGDSSGLHLPLDQPRSQISTHACRASVVHPAHILTIARQFATRFLCLCRIHRFLGDNSGHVHTPGMSKPRTGSWHRLGGGVPSLILLA
jgi:hypothetical protein